MDVLESAIQTACRDGTATGIVMQSANKSGTFHYSKAFGSLSLQQGKEALPIAEDSVFVISSCTKLMTSIAALQCVERGQITLDEDLGPILPEIAKLDVLIGFDDQEMPEFKKRQNAITLRRLLTNTSGLAYSIFHEKLSRYVKFCGNPSLGGTVASRFGSLPLAFEPGSDWMYGGSIDWAGKLVERLNGNIPLDDYMEKNIWEPLGIKDITFWLSNRPDMAERLAGMSRRNENGELFHVFESGPTDGLEECFGGQGALATMPDFLKILRSILIDDEKLLKKETAALMMSAQLEKEAKEKFDELRPRPGVFQYVIGDFVENYSPLDYGLGSMVTLVDFPGWRGRGTLLWGGAPNLFWYIDRQNEICGIFATQVLPPADPRIRELISLFERTMLKNAKDH